METVLVIHKGNNPPTPPVRHGERIYLWPSRLLFFLQAWQVLLLRHIDIAFEQDSLKGSSKNGLEGWLRRVDRARNGGRSIVQELAKQAVDHDGGACRGFVEANIIGVELQSLNLRINRQGWSPWTATEQRPVSSCYTRREIVDDGDEVETGIHVLWRSSVPRDAISMRASKRDVAMSCLSTDFSLTFVLETCRPKLKELIQVTEDAKDWTFETSLLAEGGGGCSRRRLMFWDCHDGEQRWCRYSMEELMEMQTPKQSTKMLEEDLSIESRTVRFVLMP